MEPDGVLTDRASRGDSDAFAALYERHIQDLYDFAARLLRSQGAEDAVQDAFTKAWERLQHGEVVKNFRAWMFTITRNVALDMIRQRKRTALPLGSDDNDSIWESIPTDPSVGPEEMAVKREIANLVWSSARTLSPSDYALLDLHVRRGLTVDEIADHLGGIRKGALYTRLSRLKDSMEESVTSVLLIRHGRAACSRLDALLDARQENSLGVRERETVLTHLRQCAICQESKARYMSPVEILAGLTPIPMALGLRGALWNSIEGRMGLETGSNGRMRIRRRKTPQKPLVAVAALTGAAMVLGTVVLPKHFTHERGSLQPISSLAVSPKTASPSPSFTASPSPSFTASASPKAIAETTAQTYRVSTVTVLVDPETSPFPDSVEWAPRVGDVDHSLWIIKPKCASGSCGLDISFPSYPQGGLTLNRRGNLYVESDSGGLQCIPESQGHLGDYRVSGTWRIKFLGATSEGDTRLTERFVGTQVAIAKVTAQGRRAGCVSWALAYKISGRLVKERAGDSSTNVRPSLP